jgi:septum formation protein
LFRCYQRRTQQQQQQQQQGQNHFSVTNIHDRSVVIQRIMSKNTPTGAVTESKATASSSSSSPVVVRNNNNNLVISVRDYLQTTNSNDRSSPNNDSSLIRLLLASQSPRRREILDMMGLTNRYEVIPSPLNEEALAIQLLSGTNTDDAANVTATTGSTTEIIHYIASGQIINDPKDYTRILAEEKAMALAKQMQQEYDRESSSQGSSFYPPTLVLGSDTIVVLDGKILEKPIDIDHAIQMLQSLAGRTHVVLTGVALVQVLPQPTTTTTTNSTSSTVQLLSSFTDAAQVEFVPLSEDDIRSYVATGEPMDKSGSYGIQGIGGQLIHSINGDFFTVRLCVCVFVFLLNDIPKVF